MVDYKVLILTTPDSTITVYSTYILYKSDFFETSPN